MRQKSDGMIYVPAGTSERVVEEGEFLFGAAHLDHGHVLAQCQGLVDAGGVLKYVYDPDPAKVADFRERFPQAQPVDSLDRILDDEEIHLVAAAAVPNKRCSIGLRVIDGGKDYFTDKAPFTELEQLELARETVQATGRKYLVYYSERLHNECAWLAGEMIAQGAIGKVLHVTNIAPHRLNRETRPDWFFKKKEYGGIITDIGSHQFEQFLHYAGAKDGSVAYARVANMANPETPELEDFGEAVLQLDTGASGYTRIDWFTPDGQRAWGDGRTFALGTEGVIELRKYIDVARGSEGDLIFLTDGEGEREIRCAGKVGFPAFGKLVLDVLNRTEEYMTQEHAFKAAELCLRAQEIADRTRAEE